MSGPERLKLLQPDVRADLIEALRTPTGASIALNAASPATVSASVRIVVEMRQHDHEPDDVFCENLVGHLGQRAPYLLQRLLELEEELHRLRTRSRPDAELEPAEGPDPGAVCRR
ncbi:hypothetical protein [Streptomyces sp. NRRL B-24484]|uniref:hypothetical protein n=1 Tax=Streptomyces sp. NRRL B-24484 TaxID=1463833 RepID=UPI0004C1E3CB|nr:hypothetical protein [Streptomyces sp. NRRL B-24484]